MGSAVRRERRSAFRLAPGLAAGFLTAQGVVPGGVALQECSFPFGPKLVTIAGDPQGIALLVPGKSGGARQQA